MKHKEGEPHQLISDYPSTPRVGAIFRFTYHMKRLSHSEEFQLVIPGFSLSRGANGLVYSVLRQRLTDILDQVLRVFAPD